MNEESIIGLILAGGQSRRFGVDKASHLVDGKRMIDHVLEALRPVVDGVFISVGSKDDASAEIGEELVVDLRPGRGPLAGLHAGFSATDTPWLLVVACDLPFITADALGRLVAARSRDVSAVVGMGSDGRRHPLCACYHRTLVPSIERRLAGDDFSMRGLLAGTVVREVVLPDRTLRNVNRRSDLVR